MRMHKWLILAVLMATGASPAWARKPPKAVTSTRSVQLTSALAMADGLASRMTQLVADAESPGLDVSKLQELVAAFQKEVDDNRAKSDALEAALSDPEKAELSAHIQQVSAPLVARFDAAFRRLRQEEDAKKPDRLALEGIAAALTTLLADAQAMAQDAPRRAEVQTKLAVLYAQVHTVEHRLRDPSSGLAADTVTALLEEKVGAKLVRIERLMRMTLQPRSAAYLDTVQQLPALTARGQTLAVSFSQASDLPALEPLWVAEAGLREQVAMLSANATLLQPDEVHELRAIAVGGLGPVLDRLAEESTRAQTRLESAP